MVFTSFLCAFTAKHRPLILFFDDLQFADSSSLHILQLFITHSTCQNVFFILSYRSDEVDEQHPLTSLLSSVRSVSVPLTHLHLEPLRISHYVELLSDTFHFPSSQLMRFATKLHKLTVGNPFHAVQLLRTWHQRGFIHFVTASAQSISLGQATEGHWEVNYSKIEQDTTEDEATVQNLLTQRIAALPVETLRLLQGNLVHLLNLNNCFCCLN